MSNSDTASSPKLYDICMTSACKSQPNVRGATLVQTVMQPPKHLSIGVPLDVARRYLHEIQNAGGYGMLVPLHYRSSKLTVDDGLEHAEQAFALRRVSGQKYNAVELVRDEGAYWIFRATRQEPFVEPDRIPGTLYLYIDKVDGHVLTLEEIDRWARLSTDSQ